MYKEVFSQILSTFKFTDTPDTSTWKTYRNEKHGIEFKHPTNFKVEADTVELSGFICVKGGNVVPPCQVIIHSNLNELLYPRDIYNERITSLKILNVPIKETELQIGAENAKQIVANYKNETNYYLFLEKNERVYSFFYELNDKTVADKIISTVRFIEPDEVSKEEIEEAKNRYLNCPDNEPCGVPAQ